MNRVEKAGAVRERHARLAVATECKRRDAPSTQHSEFDVIESSDVLDLPFSVDSRGVLDDARGRADLLVEGDVRGSLRVDLKR